MKYHENPWCDYAAAVAHNGFSPRRRPGQHQGAAVPEMECGLRRTA